MQSLSISRIGLLLAIALMGAGTFISIQALINPLSLPWSNLEEPVILPVDQLNPPQTIQQIKTELSDLQLVLGDKLITSSSGYEVYPIIDKDSKSIRQIRIYQTLNQSFWLDDKKKLRLIEQTEVSGLEETFVKAPSQKYLKQPKPINSKNILPLTELQPIYGDAPSQGIWFMTAGRIDGIVYGRVFSFIPSQVSLYSTLEWTNPNGKLPEWQRFPTVKSPEPDLIVDQTQDSDPLFLVFRLEATPNSQQLFQFRHLNLNESPAMPKLYSDALVLASAGLWSPALAKLEVLKSTMPAWEPNIQEQYDLIDYHAKITAAEAKRPNSDYGMSSLALGMDGLWGDALKNLQGSDFGAKIVMETIETSGSHLWLRVNAALEIDPTPEVVMWGSVIVLQRQDLPSAEQWLRSHWKFPKRDISEAINLLQRLDISPLGIEPQQFIGSVRLVGTTLEDKWQITPPPLLLGQTWYEVDISIIRDRDTWRNSPFPQLETRSRLMIWKALGLESNNILSVEIPNTQGETTSLIAQSIWVGNGQIKLLATGSPELAGSLANGLNNSSGTSINPNLQSTLAKGLVKGLVKGGNLFIESRGTFTTLESLDREVGDRISGEIYRELRAFGNVSLSAEEFRERISKWSIEQVNLQSKDRKDSILKIERDQIDLGDRSYPIVMIFSKNGDLLFGEMAAAETRRWIASLPSSNPQKILIKSNGVFESLSFLVP